MKRELCTTVGGREVIRLIPETEDDIEELRRLDRAGLLDSHASFGDHAKPRSKQTEDTTRRSGRRSG